MNGFRDRLRDGAVAAAIGDAPGTPAHHEVSILKEAAH